MTSPIDFKLLCPYCRADALPNLPSAPGNTNHTCGVCTAHFWLETIIVHEEFQYVVHPGDKPE